MTDDPPLWIKSGVMVAPANEAAAQVVMGLKPGKAVAMEPKELSAGTLEHHNFLMALAQLIFQNADWGELSFDGWRTRLKYHHGWGEVLKVKGETVFIPETWVPHKLGKDNRNNRIDALMDLAINKGIAECKDEVERMVKGERIAA